MEKGDIYLITAAFMLVALEIIDIGLHTPEACVLSVASFEVRGPQSQNAQVTLSPPGCVPTTLRGHTVTDTAVKHTHKQRRMPACHTEKLN